MSENTFGVVVLFLLLLLVTVTLILVNANSSREHEQYILCIESGNQWISGSCIGGKE